jgi:DNA-binding transcriptional regulator YiaG
MLTASDIQRARKELGESQAAFAARFGVDQSTIHRWETEGPPKRGPAALGVKKLFGDLPIVREAGARVSNRR